MSELPPLADLEPGPGELGDFLNQLADDPNSAISDEMREFLAARRLLSELNYPEE